MATMAYDAPHSYTPGPAETARGRRPPYSEDAEQAVLSAMLTDQSAILRALEVVDDTMFYAERHRRIFRAMVSITERGGVVDPLTVSDELGRCGELESSGGKDYIGFLVDVVPIGAHVEDHARIVRAKADLRALIEHTQAALHDAYAGERPAADIAADLQRTVLPLSIDTSRAGFVAVKDDLWAVMEDIESAARGGRSARVIPTGYAEIDERIAGGFERGHFIVLAGVPGSAKTTVALNFALNVATADPPIGVAFVSAEMSRESLIKRSLSNLSQVPLASIRSGCLRDDEYARLSRGAACLSAARLWVDQAATPDIGSIMAKCRKEKADHPEIGLVIVDFIQLVQRKMDRDRRGRDENRSAELTAISYGLQGLAKELDVAVIATSQVDAAAIESRADKRPKLGEARWSQGMREAAHLFATVYRPRMYNPEAFDTIELDFQKGRDDPPFVARFDWNGQYMLMKSKPAARGAEP